MTIGGLGSGLDFLYDENATEVQVKKTLRVSELEPNRDQPRKQFSDEAIQTLADSIQQYGMIQPILVRPLGLNYQIVAGERRWRAARMLGMDEVPVVIRELTDEETMAVALIENLQREDLNPLEEANAYAQLMDMFHLTQEEVAKRVGKSRSAVANSLRLLKLPEDVKTLVEDGGLSAGHARALLAVEDPELRKKIAEKCTKENLSVREIETLVKLDKLSKAKKEKKSSPEAQELRRLKVIYKDLERKMKTKLGTKVSIVPKNTERGTLEIEYYSQDDLDRIFMILNSSRND